MLYQKQAEHDDAPTIPMEIDADLTAVMIGQRLGVPAPLVERLPVHWVSSVMIQMRAEALERERHAKQMERGRRKGRRR